MKGLYLGERCIRSFSHTPAKEIDETMFEDMSLCDKSVSDFWYYQHNNTVTSKTAWITRSLEYFMI